jgi:hypothetical protein
MRYYGNVMTTRWRLCVTMETLGRHALLVADTQIGLYKKKKQQVQSTTVLLKMYDTSITSSVYISVQKYSHVIDVFYIFNSTVVD